MIRLNRPEKLNALNRQLMEEVSAALAEFTADDGIGAIVLAGEGRAFSAGFDLNELAKHNFSTPMERARDIQINFDFIMQFWDNPKPTIAAIHGFCVAGALELSLACDITVAAEDTLLGEPEVKFGSSVLVMILPWIVGPKFAKEMLLTGDDTITVQRAYEAGLINYITPPHQHESRAMELANAIANADPLSVKMTKRAINRGFDVRGLRESLVAAADIATLNESNPGPKRVEFDRILAADGLNAAVAWRNSN